MIVDITRSKYPACASNSKSRAIEKIDYAKYEAIVSQIAKIEADLFGPGSWNKNMIRLLYTSPSPRDGLLSRMPSSA